MQETYRRFKKTLLDGTSAVNKLNDEIKQLQEKIDSGVYTAATTKEFKRTVDELRRKKQQMIPVILGSADEIIDDYVTLLEQQDMPRGEDITADAKLLQSGIRLNEKELVSLMQKEENQTSTMHRLFSQYAKDNDINQIGRAHV